MLLWFTNNDVWGFRIYKMLSNQSLLPFVRALWGRLRSHSDFTDDEIDAQETEYLPKIRDQSSDIF